MSAEFLNQLKKSRLDYGSMIEFCCNHVLLNNYIYEALSSAGYYFDFYCGNLIEYYDKDGNEVSEEEYENIDDGCISYKDVYQYYLISGQDAERLREFTKEVVIYNEELDIYLLCVTHYGTAWSGISANWKEA